MVRIKDIAKAANVSEGTVDRVIHNRGGVSKKTEARIKQIIKEKNFSVNLVASALAMKNKYIITVLIPEFTEEDAFWKSPYLGISKAAEEFKNLGITIHIIHFNQYDTASYETAFAQVLETQPSAVLFVPLFQKETKKFVSQLEATEIPYAFLNVDIEGFNNLFFIGQDSFTAGYIAGKLTGFSIQKTARVLLIQSRDNTDDNNTISKRIEGFHSFIASTNGKLSSLVVKIADLNDKSQTRRTIQSQLSDNTSIQGIFVPSSRASTVISYLNTDQLKTLSVIGFDTTPQNTQCLQNEELPFLISQKTFEQGLEGIRLLADFLTKKKLPSKKIFLPIDILTKENLNYNEGGQYHFEREATVS